MRKSECRKERHSSQQKEKKNEPNKDFKHAQTGGFDLGGYSKQMSWLAIILGEI